jgi:hypothetical protein
MAEFKLDRFKYDWKGNWQAGTAYKRDDVVRVNGKSYVCIITHTASSAFRTDLTAILPESNPPQLQPRWTVMTSGQSFVGDWTGGTNYNLGDIVKYNGSLWLCVNSHAASSFASNFNNWEVFAQTSSFVGNWSSGVSYTPGAIVKYNGIAYKCETAHTSGSTLETNLNDWQEYHVGVEVKNTWETNTLYRKNDLVKYGGTVYRCIETHTSSSFDITKFEIEVFGSQFEGIWSSSTSYNIGDIVNHGGFVYYAINNNTGSKPFVDNGSTDWILLSRSQRFIGAWSLTFDYKTGDIVLRGGSLYKALRDIGQNESVDGSTLDYLEADTWELLVPGSSWKGQWAEEQRYSLGDVVYFQGTAYTCNFEHTSSNDDFPGDNGNVFNYWDILLQAGRPGGLVDRGDLLTYGFARPKVGFGKSLDGSSLDTSTLGDTRIPIGTVDQNLSVSADLEAHWRNVIQDSDTVFVSKSGIDDEGRGTFEKPFRTVRYAAEYVEDNYTPLTPVIIRIATGRYEEISPIIVPAGCAINGDELRSTTIVASTPIAEYQNDFQYVESYLDYFDSVVLDIVTGNRITPQEGNTVEQITNEDDIEIPVSPVTGLPAEGFENVVLFPSSNLAGANLIIDLIDDYRDYISFRIQNGTSNPTISGSNIRRLSTVISNAGKALTLNKNFIVADFIAYLKNSYPTITFNEHKIKGDILALLRGLSKDLEFSGNYRTLIAARRYANAVTGSQFDSIFFMRDSTGLRDLTTSGLRGVLNPPGVFDLYQKPTGGACVSFDPGWGPSDERTWIVNRSPYIQGVTNIGTGCIGKKLDGTLHNGGLKSMVSNDFTQVLSDGIGVWVSDNARTELVSVFTYYCQIGYFAENGGIIRATNGNNSYGRYGSIADGDDATEIPQQVTVFNRNNEAQVISAFAGGSTDTIFAFEYTNAGEEYTQATAEIIGAGANASVEYTDFRDGALFEARLINTRGSGSEGGAGYLTRQGSAQETLDASSSIKLSANDVTQFFSDIEGMRVLITDGLGSGQYGYASAYDFVNKLVTIRRESDGELGWDHIIPGTPIEAGLDLTTRYRIEPRISVSHPGFNSTSYDLVTNRTYVDASFGGTTETYTSITGPSSALWTDNENNAVTVRSVISSEAVQFDGIFLTNPRTPFNIIGKLSGTEFTVNVVTANAESYIEVNGVGNTSTFIDGEQLGLVFTAGSGDTFGEPAVAATFTIVRAGDTYTPSLTNPGAGYNVGDVIIFPGTLFGGTTPANDLQITITDVSSDSTNSIESFTSTGRARPGRFVSLTDSQYARWSDDAINWTETNLSFIGDYRKLISGNNRFIALANNENRVSVSLTGQTWSTVNLPVRESWSDGTYGGGRFVLIANNTNNILTSTDGTTFSTVTIPSDTAGDSTVSQWTRITHGKGKFVAVSANDRATATSTNGTSWTRHDLALPEITVGNDWNIVSIAYGNNRFIILDNEGRTAYSFDGVTWYRGTTAPGSLTWSQIKYDQGVFFAIGLDGVNPTTACATTEDGLVWNARTLDISQRWSALTFGKVNGESRWVILASSASTRGINHVRTGARAKLRADVLQGKFENIKIWDPGSGYATSNLPVITVTDPNFTTAVETENRIGNGVLSQPDFVNRGAGYRTTTSRILISGNGYADIIPEANELVLAGLITIPSPGVQIRIAGIFDLLTENENDLQVFSGAIITDLGDDGSGNGTRLVRFTISPGLDNEYNLEHGTAVSLRSRYSQCRITGHDFLDIGTGNFEQTNYPEIYAGGNFFTAAPENEVLEQNGGRVFYTSTDQDGNFRTGELFSVQQSTGTVTISAEFFDLDGLSELALGGVRLGGSGTVVSEFSTDPTFSADSNNVIPTQRAIATFIANRLSVGGENLEVNQLRAGRVVLGGEGNNISSSVQQYVFIPVDITFDGTYLEPQLTGPAIVRQTGISGTIVSQMLFLKGFDEGMQ